MSRFRKSEPREVPVLNTAALPDLIFTILFFFMLVTNMRPVPVKTQFDLPVATELQKLEEKSSVVYIMIGGQQDKNGETGIQLNADFISLHEMPASLEKIKRNPSLVSKGDIVVVLKADRNTPMKTINEVKKNLRNAGMLTVHYSVEKSR